MASPCFSLVSRFHLGSVEKNFVCRRMPGGDRKSWCSEPEKLGWLTPRWGSQIVSQADVNLHCDEPKTSSSVTSLKKSWWIVGRKKQISGMILQCYYPMKKKIGQNPGACNVFPVRVAARVQIPVWGLVRQFWPENHPSDKIGSWDEVIPSGKIT